jgi:hypothetical protein
MKYEYRYESINDDTAATLNTFAAQGWRLVSREGCHFILERIVSEVPVKAK